MEMEHIPSPWETVHTCSSSHNAQRQIYESGTFLEKSLNPNYFFFSLVWIKLEPKYRSFVQKLYISYPWDCESRWRRWGPEYQMPSLKSRARELKVTSLSVLKDNNSPKRCFTYCRRRNVHYWTSFDMGFHLKCSSIWNVLPPAGRQEKLDCGPCLCLCNLGGLILVVA